MNKIILFYKYVDIENPQSIKDWQQELCQDLNLKGRIILATEGINGTLSGNLEDLQSYMIAMEEHPLFGGIDFKDSEGEADHFPRLRVMIRKEIVNLGIDPQELSFKETGKHLTPEQAHNLMAQAPKDLVILDTRNDFESAIGTFTNAVKADIKHFRDFPAYVDEHLDEYKDKEVLMFCTGGVRCERATAYLKQKGIAKEVYQIQGGIHRYAEQFPDGFFRGKNYVFDGRIAMKVNDDILAQCSLCEKPCDEYSNCLNASCNKHFICCDECLNQYGYACSQNCLDLLNAGKVAARPLLKRHEINNANHRSSCGL